LAERLERGKAMRMKLAILETGRPPGDLAGQFGDYPAMIARILGGGFEIETFDVAGGRLPESPAAHDAYVITGSPAGVYDPLPWIDDLCRFIRMAQASKMIGICFGHQVMAQALGGRVEKADKGWGVGLHRYAVTRTEPWMGESVAEIAVPVSHQDQVVARPPNTEVFATSQFTPFAALSWTDRPAISVQFHPEFEPDYARALVAHRRDQLPDADAAIASLDAPDDRHRVAQWLRRFLSA
jgi:GMP synthase-like glutamine amidotransferase